jgi:hypothetical protein
MAVRIAIHVRRVYGFTCKGACFVLRSCDVMLERQISAFFFFESISHVVQGPVLAHRECTCVHFQLRRVYCELNIYFSVILCFL